MALNKLYLDGTVGLTYIEHPLFFGAELFQVKRQGKPLFPDVTGVPDAREFYHDGTRIYLAADMPVELVPDPGGHSVGGVNDIPMVPEAFYVKFKS